MFGMKVACALLRRALLDPGKWEANIQFAMARKIRSTHSNVFHASCQVRKVSSMAYEISKAYQSKFSGQCLTVKWITRKLTEFSNLIIFGFCCRLQGEEMVWR
jgi:hypothetical protein